MPEYTREAFQKMICNPRKRSDAHKVFKREMVRAVASAKPTATNHEKMLARVVKARRKVARLTDDKRVGNLMDRSYYLSGDTENAPQIYSYGGKDAAFPREFRQLYHLAKTRLVDPELQKRANEPEIFKRSFEIETDEGSSFYERGTVSIGHIDPARHPEVLDRLKRLWEDAHNCESPEEKLRQVAQYEWWFYQANPINRGGASIGDCMSALLRKSIGLPLERYKHRDWEALTLPLDEYVRRRVSGRI